MCIQDGDRGLLEPGPSGTRLRGLWENMDSMEWENMGGLGRMVRWMVCVGVVGMGMIWDENRGGWGRRLGWSEAGWRGTKWRGLD